MSDTTERPHPGPKQEPGLDRDPGEHDARSSDTGPDSAADSAADNAADNASDNASDDSSADDSSSIGSSDVRSAVVESARQAGYGDGEKDGQDYLDRNDVPYDPAEGLLSGTAITGETEIPGDHENTDAVDADDAEEHSEDAVERQG